MKKSSVLLCGILFAAFSSASAFADSIYDFSFTPSGNFDNKFSGSGSFTVTEQSADVYLITGISGTIIEGSNVGSHGPQAITSLLAAGSFNGNDNLLLYPNNKPFDGNGVAFVLADGSKVRLYNNNNEFLLESVANGGSSFSEGSDIKITYVGTTAATAPEPGSLMLLGTGVLGIAGAVRRKLSV